MTNSSKKVTRQYHGSDADMETRAETMHNHAVTYQGQLAAVDPEITNTFLTNFETKVNNAKNAVTAAANASALRVLTEDVLAKMQAARTAYEELRFYVKKTFSADTGIQESFGIKRYNNARKNQSGLYKLMKEALASATAHSAALIAKGYTNTKITALGTLATSLDDSDVTQNTRKGTNVVSTEDYIDLHNLAWADMETISNAAKQAFKDDPAIYSLFTLYAGGGSNMTTLLITDIMGGGTTENVDLTGHSITENTHFMVITTSIYGNIEGYFSDLINGTPAGMIKNFNSPSSINTIASEMSYMPGRYFTLRNNSAEMVHTEIRLML